MATLLFAAAGQAIGAGFGGSILGLSGAVIGQAVGAVVGRAIDQRLLGGLSPVKREGPRLDSLDVMTSQEGAPLYDIAGRCAIAGEVIWATKLKEVTSTETERVGSGKQKQTVSTTVYDYFSSFAVSLGEGPMTHVGRIWADGKLIDLSDMIAEGRLRFYAGSETQMPDPLIAAVEGSAPAYRGTAYLVFEDMPLTDFGNRVPQIKVEVWGQSGDMEALIKGVNIIPGSTEWGYMPTPVTKVTRGASGAITSETKENATRHGGVADWSLSMGALGAILPKAKTASLVVSWFGTDLRAGQCEVEPRVEIAVKETSVAWSAGGLSRTTANVVSQVDGRPAFGSAPADISVVRAIADLRARGYRVVLYPFIMMDVTEAQALPDPSGAGTQGAYPWRGRIAPDAGAGVGAEVSAFLGTAQPAHFTVAGEAVSYSGPAAWRYRRFILHLANLAKAAGGVDAFLIGSELRGLTMATDTPGSYPFVDGLKTLAADVSGVLPAAQIGYAADWSEYHSHRQGSEVYFHLDPLWADPNIDFVGIDNYLPLADWRPGVNHADYDNAKGHTTPYAMDYLKGNIEGGEYWDWYYADDAARAAQARTPISDGAYGEDWVFRQKAIRAWHGNPHHHRPGGVRDAGATAWVPGSKPVWFTELGCPAVDLAANRPNVFSAATSSESSFPWFSEGIRDDFMQRQFLRASLEWWRDNGAGILSINDVQIWCWDARLWPEFPTATSQWTDGRDWALGHWLNGRAGAAPAEEAIRRRLTAKHGLSAADFDLTTCYGQADGYPQTAPIGFRDFLNPLEIGLGLQAHEADGQLVVEARAAAITVADTPDTAMVDVEDGSPFAAKRGAIEDVAGEAVLKFRNGNSNYGTTAARAVISVGYEDGVATVDSPLVLDFDRGNAAVERLLRSAADGRETLTFRLPRSATHVRPGVILPVVIGARAPRPMIVEKVTDGTDRAVELRSFNRAGYAPTGGVFRPGASLSVLGSSAVLARLLDLPLIAGLSVNEWDGFAAAHAQPWPGAAVVARSTAADAGFGNAVALPLRATMGETTADLAASRASTWVGGPLDLRLYSGTLVGRPDDEVLAGANAMAIDHGGEWEVVQFRDAALVAAGEWRLTGLLRGQRGTEHLAAQTLPAGAAIVVLGDAVMPLGLTTTEAGLPFWFRSGAAAKPVSTHTVQAHTPARISERPFAPAHLAARVTGGDTALSWHRRTRKAVTTWPASGAEPPIGETAELYRVEIGPAGAPLRVTDVALPALIYTATERSSDGITAPFRVAVAQVSETYGPGIWAEITVTE